MSLEELETLRKQQEELERQQQQLTNSSDPNSAIEGVLDTGEVAYELGSIALGDSETAEVASSGLEASSELASESAGGLLESVGDIASSVVEGTGEVVGGIVSGIFDIF